MAWHTRFQGTVRGDWRDVTVRLQEDLGEAPAEVLPLDLPRELLLSYGEAGGLDGDGEEIYGDVLLASSVQLAVLDDDGEGGTPLFDALDAAQAAGEEASWRVVITAPAAEVRMAAGLVAMRAYAWTGRPRLSTLDRTEFPGIEGQATVVEAACGLAAAKEEDAVVVTSPAGIYTLAGRLVAGLAPLLGTEEGPSIPIRFVMGWHGQTSSPPAGPIATVETLRPGVAVYEDPDGVGADLIVDPFDADNEPREASRVITQRLADLATMLRELAGAFDCRLWQAITAHPYDAADPVPDTPAEDAFGRWLEGNEWLFAHPWALGVEVDEAVAGYAPASVITEETVDPCAFHIPPLAVAPADVSAPPDHRPRRRTLRPLRRAEILRKARSGARFGPPGYTTDPAFRHWIDANTIRYWDVLRGTVERVSGVETQYACKIYPDGSPPPDNIGEITARGPVVAAGTRIIGEARAYAKPTQSASALVVGWGLSIEGEEDTYYLNSYTNSGAYGFTYPTGRLYWSTVQTYTALHFGAGRDDENDWAEYRSENGPMRLAGAPPCPVSGILRFHLFAGPREPIVDSAELLLPDGVVTAVAEASAEEGGTVRAPFVLLRERGLVGVGEVPWEQLRDDGGGGTEWVPAFQFQDEDVEVYDDLAVLECTSLLQDRGEPGAGFADAGAEPPAALYIRVNALVPPEQPIEYPAGSGRLWRVGAGATLDLVRETTEGVFVRINKVYGAH